MSRKKSKKINRLSKQPHILQDNNINITETRENPLIFAEYLGEYFTRRIRDFDTLYNDRIKNYYFKEIEDLRRFKPYEEYKTRFGRPSDFGYSIRPVRHFHNNRFRASFYTKLGFNYPKNVLVCLRRNLRRKILFAFQKIGKGKGGSLKKPHWTSKSYISCFKH